MCYAEFLGQVGRSGEAVSEIQQALMLDPLSLSTHVQAGWVYYLARNDDEALAHWHKALDLEPNFAVVHSSLWAAYLQKSDFSEVLTTLSKEELLEDSPLNLAALAGSYASAGNRSQARKVIAKLNAISATDMFARTNWEPHMLPSARRIKQLHPCKRRIGFAQVACLTSRPTPD